MKNTIKKFFIGSVACTLAVACAFSCCKPVPPAYEEGTIVKFNYNDGIARPYSVEVNDGEKVEAPTTPTREGYDFSHWATAAEKGEQVTFPFTATADTELFAVWVPMKLDVTFDLNYPECENTVLQVEYDKTVEKPATDPVRDGYQFMYWQERADGGAEITFPYTVKRDVSFYAYWIDAGLKIFNVTFDLNYENPPAEAIPASKSVVEGESLTERDLAKVERAGFEFLGWSETPTGEAISAPYTPTDTMTLYALWKQNEYKVNYRYNWPDSPGFNFKSETVLGGELAVEPETPPTREGHTFVGWYNTAVGGNQIDFSQPIVGHANYYAHWQSDEVVTDTFHAEFTYISATENFPGYSGEAYGAGIIVCDDTGDSCLHTENDYVPGSMHLENHGHYTSYLYKENATLTFEIYSDKAVSNATLQASLAAEVWSSMVIAPTGETAYKFIVNDQEINYNAISFAGEQNISAGQYKCAFKLYTIGNISLKAGKNIIKLVTANNSGKYMGGTMGAVAPLVDAIKITNAGSAKLSYYPIYDNLWQSYL